MRSASIVLTFLAASAFAPSEALAYCFSAACPDGSEQFCDQDLELPPSCRLIRWKSGCTGFVIQEDGGPSLPPDELTGFVRQAFDAWQNADCGGGTHPGVFSVDMGTAPCNKIEYNREGGNQNVIIVRHIAWPHPPTAGHDIALTTTTFDPDTGELLDADMELNAANFSLTTSDDMVEYDLMSVLTHESGHFLGIAHSFDDTATMRPSYDAGTIDLRTLAPDDDSVICLVYPPDDSVTAECSPLGRHGFSPDCLASQTEGSCAIGHSPATNAAWIAGVALAFAARVRARSAGRRR